MPFTFRRVFAASTTVVAFALCLGAALPSHAEDERRGVVSAPALPTLHPAFLLRQPMAKRQAWADMLSLAARLDNGDAR